MPTGVRFGSGKVGRCVTVLTGKAMLSKKLDDMALITTMPDSIARSKPIKPVRTVFIVAVVFH
jgi:hypothetical protein